jgi:hypothetical protein
MGQFKPMVKMTTTEPSVILKLKKGGKVASKSDGHKAMHETMESSMFESAEHGKAPKKPSMSARRQAMNPQFKKGGKVAHREMGGGMPMGGAPMAAPAAPMGAPMGGAGRPPMRAPMAAMGRAKLAAMAPAMQAARAAQVRRALTGMKKGGSTASCAALERDLKHHESLSGSKAHPQKKAEGGSITAPMAKTTIKGNAGKFVNTDMETADRKNPAKGTGAVKNGAAGYADGGTISGNEGKFKDTMMVTADRTNSAKGTGAVKMGAAGYKGGGTISGDWENRPADTAEAGVTNTSTGGVRNGAGGYKKGGSAKKAYATGGNVVDDGKAEKMPSRPKSQPVANNMQSGTYRRGGKVRKSRAYGGSC